MIVIADSNIIISALISPRGSIAYIFKEKSNIQFIAPDYLLEEVYEHWSKISKTSSLSRLELIKEFDFYKKRIVFTNVENIPKNHKLKAYEIVKDIDKYDTPFVSLYLYKKHKIWTGDKILIKGLLAKGYDICVTTAQLKQKIYKKK